MTLASFKKHIRLFSLFTFLVLYALVFFLFGRHSSINLKNLFNGNTQEKKAKEFNTPVQSPLTEDKSQNGNVISAYVKLCASTVYSFQVAYPKDWFTTYNKEEEKCRYFAPYSFIVPSSKDDSFVPISIEVSSPQKWQETVKFFENPNDFQNVISSQNLEIASRAAKKVTSFSTGQGSMSKNFKKISYLVFDSQFPLVITYTQTTDTEDSKAMEDTLNEMVSSLKFF